MKIAIPIFGTRISPRFDCAPSIAILECENGAVINRREVSIGKPPRIRLLVKEKVDVLICGGIRRWDFDMLRDHGIEVYFDLCGEAEAVIRAFLNNELVPSDRWEKQKTSGNQDIDGRRSGRVIPPSFRWLA
jgi:predicted Fe-Mo cluster-binding NifX family protein